MAKTSIEILAEFGPAMGTFTARLDSLEKTIDELSRRQTEGGTTHQSLHREVVALREQIEVLNRWKIEIGSLVEIKTDMAVMKRDMDELREAKDRWIQRLWNLLGPLVGAAAGALLTYALRK